MSNDQKIEVLFAPFATMMQEAQLTGIATANFRYYFSQLLQGNTGSIPENTLHPIEQLLDTEKLSQYKAAGEVAFAHTVIMKLNGGLGTSMGLHTAKSLLPAKNNLTFLDVIVRQVLALRQATGHPIPLIMMDSFNTRTATLAALANYPELAVADLPLDFVQNKIPKILQDSYAPAKELEVGELAWCPPGHGDFYTVIQTSGLLAQLLAQGYQYLFISNADNLGAVLDPAILGYFAAEKLPFLMEVAERTAADSKGGHLAVRQSDNHLMLREIAQCPPEDQAFFGDITRHRFFNTNNNWINLTQLQATLDANQGVLKLPLIRNLKNLDPRDSTSPKVYQLETAIGAAIEVFPNAGAIRVGRERFAPVKLCSDLLTLWSDAFILDNNFTVMLNPANRYGLPVVQLDNRYYRLIDDLQARFPHGAPSLKDCQFLRVEGDFSFGANVTVRGNVTLLNDSDQPHFIPDNTILEGQPL